MPRILLKFNDSILKVLETNKDQITIGRNLKNDIQIDNLAVSNFHARVEKQLGHYFIEDLNSTNGTYVNERKISKWGLNDNDAVNIGKHTLIFLMDEAEDGEGETDLRELDMDRTMILDTRQQRDRLEKATKGGGSREAGGFMGILEVIGGSLDQGEYQLTERLTMIGKDEGAAIRLEGLLAPKIAGFVSRDKNGYTLIPPEKRNKLKLNGHPLEEGTLLKDADQVEIGGVKLRFHLKG
ncbi:MAG TPA: FHA domain-containing protein [Deferrimonas sp.]|jgi:predicted component of type VI protein secretion system